MTSVKHTKTTFSINSPLTRGLFIDLNLSKIPNIIIR
ncbi:hypothetical protein J2S17_002118 [Cytobacillus purgationiresistens]|uniref:Uncharacterized protein n=1 Tax=Cytobacillus purgationiresistens TaxID=863449 RepID=A0ABU0AIG9_9BACI|nr:hypothetical protein [Cytobacillus purgationiresistens]